MKKIIAVVLAVVLVFSAAMYSGGTEVQAAPKKGKVKKISVTNLPAKTLTLKKGKSKVLKVKVSTSGKKVSKAITFSSSNSKVVSVSRSGKNVKVKAKKKGKATITIKSKASSKKKVKIKVTVGTPANKVAINKTSASLISGQKLQLNATVTTKKTSNKKVIWKTSSSNIATVNSKGLVTAKKAGHVTITAVAADGSGKKATCKLTVNNPTDIKEVKVMNSNVIRVTLTNAQSLNASAFTVKAKYYSKGTYNRNCKIQSMYSTDNINYYITLQDYDIDRGSYIQVTIKGLAGNSGVKTKETEYEYTVANYNTYDFVGLEYNEEVDYDIYLDDGVGYVTATWSGIPAGLKAERSDIYSYINISGKPTTKGKSNTVVTYKDEVGNTYTKNITFMICSSTNIVAAAAPVYATTGSDNTAYVGTFIDVAGVSYDYSYEIVGNAYGLRINSDEGYIYGDLAAGTYNVNVKVTDNENTNLTTTCTVTFNVKKGITVKGVVKDLSGNVLSDARVEFDSRSLGDPYSEYYSAYTDDKGQFTAVVASGKYDIFAYADDCESYYLFDYNITTNKSGLSLTINGYKVTINSNNSAVDKSYFGDWYDSENNYCGFGDELVLKPGTYKLTCTGYSFISSYTATVSVTVNGPKNVVASVTSEDIGYQDIELNNPINAFLTDAVSYYRFVPKESGTYYFYSINGSDPTADLYDEYGKKLSSNDDYSGLDFCIAYECEKGKVYYLSVESLDDSEYTDIIVSDECDFYNDDNY